MTEGLLKRRLALGPVMTAMLGYCLVALSDAMGWDSAALPGLAGGGLASSVVAWCVVRSERSHTGGPVLPRAGVVVAAAGAATLLIRLGPPELLYGVLVGGFALFLGLVVSAGYELLRGTYADSPDRDRKS